MRRLIPLIALVLAGCVNAPQYDPNEYLLVSLIKKNAMVGTKNCSVNSKLAAYTDGSKVLDIAQTYSIYSEHLLNNNDSYNISKNIVDMSSKLVENSSKNISVSYCEDKFNNIISSSDMALKALAKKARN